ncbi:MAG: hypothetical protein PVF06_02435 [Gammaproteobacteria bacterium]|jgi:hypothetical protein
MSSSDSDIHPSAETLEHLLGVVVENREKRCQQVRDNAYRQAAEILRQAHAHSRGRMHRHLVALREKYRIKIASATARNQTLLRQQHQKEDRAILDAAWPKLREAMVALWQQPDSRVRWLDAVIETASGRLREHHWHIEHPSDLSEDDKTRIMRASGFNMIMQNHFTVDSKIEAGIRILAKGTIIDATHLGLLKQKHMIEAQLIAHIKQRLANDA